MSENPSPASPVPSPQTTNVFVDRPCLKCGYNLRGQTATWNRRALNWQVVCPECGGTQVVVLGSAERNLGGNPSVAITLAVLGLAILWQLTSWLAYGFGAMMNSPLGTVRTFPAVSRTRPSLSSALDQSWELLATHFLTRSIPIALPGVGLGVLIASAGYASARQRNTLLLLITFCACLAGFYPNATGATLDPLTRAQWSAANGGLVPLTTSDVYDWKYKAVTGLVGLILAITAGRIGLASGRPLLGMVAGMYVKRSE